MLPQVARWRMSNAEIMEHLRFSSILLFVSQMLESRKLVETCVTVVIARRF